jgi:hypothetical protein
MANKKISELQSRTPSLSDLMLVGDPSSGYSYKCTITALATLIETDIADGYVTIGTTQTISGAKTFSNVLTLTSVANATTDTDKFLVLNGSNVVNYRTGSEVLSDIGGQGALTLTTTGTSGAATLVGNTLNIPQYQTALTNPVTGTGTTNYLAKFTSTSAIGNSIVFDDGTNVGISTSSPSYKLDVSGTLRSTLGAYFATSSGNIGFGTTSPTGIGGPILHIKAGSIPEIHLTNSTTDEFYNDGFSLNLNGLNTYFTNYENGFLSFSTNNTERVRIAGDGNVTFSQIANATTDTDKFLVSDSGVIKYRTGSELLSDIGGQAALTNPVTGTGTTNYIPKFTGTSAIGNSVIYEASGNVGIGTTSPTAFTGYTSVAANGTSGGAFVTMANGTSALRVISSTTDAAIWEPRNSPILFGVNNAEQMRLTSTGLGIGTTSPSNKLVISNGGAYGFEFDPAGSTLLTYNRSTSSYATFALNSLDYQFYTSASERMRITSGGNVGIGSTTPTAISNYVALTINGTSGSFTEYQQGGSYAFRVGSDNSEGGFISQTTNNPIRIFTNSNERMRITAGGLVGIGTTTPSIYSVLSVNKNGTGEYSGVNITNANSTANLFVGVGGSAVGNASLQNNAYVLNAAASALILGTSDTERMRIKSGGVINLSNVPSSATGLATGDIYRDGDGYLLIVL